MNPRSEFMLPRLITTERLRLVPASRRYAEGIFEAYASDPEVTRYLQWTPHESPDDTRRFLASCEIGWEHGTRYPYVICLGSDVNPVGMIEVHSHAGEFRLEVGYVLARPFWGKNYMTEALRALLAECFLLENVYRVQAMCHVDNIGSARVMEKSGMQFEGILRRYLRRQRRDIPEDVRMYARIRNPTAAPMA